MSWLRTLPLALAFLAIPSLSTAQSPTPARPDIDEGTKIHVVNQQGMEIIGTVLAITKDRVELDTATGPRALNWTDIQLITKKDSNWNGFLIGSGIGLASGLALKDMFRTKGGGLVPTEAQNFIAVIGTLGYGMIGVLIDNAVEGRDVIYTGATHSLSASVAPLVSLGAQARIGVAAAITWK